MEKKIDNSAIIGQVGHSFDVMLESMVFSTNYGWCLKSMPDGVELISTNSMPIRPGIAPVRQIFTFAALKPIKKAELAFDLLCLHDLTRTVADTVVFDLYVHAENENDALTKEIGKKAFFKGAGSMSHTKVPVAVAKELAGRIHLLYGYPNPAEDSIKVIHSATNCLLKYGTPFGLSAEKDECNLKYGFPIPPIEKYGFPLSDSANKPLKIKEDKANCIVKYGTPGGISSNSAECILKYGFPVSE